jgi:hypothetical protein
MLAVTWDTYSEGYDDLLPEQIRKFLAMHPNEVLEQTDAIRAAITGPNPLGSKVNSLRLWAYDEHQNTWLCIQELPTDSSGCTPPERGPHPH